MKPPENPADGGDFLANDGSAAFEKLTRLRLCPAGGDESADVLLSGGEVSHCAFHVDSNKYDGFDGEIHFHTRNTYRFARYVFYFNIEVHCFLLRSSGQAALSRGRALSSWQGFQPGAFPRPASAWSARKRLRSSGFLSVVPCRSINAKAMPDAKYRNLEVSVLFLKTAAFKGLFGRHKLFLIVLSSGTNSTTKGAF